MHSLPAAVIFDMDGLVLDTERLAYDVLSRVSNDQGYEFPLEVYRKLIGRAAADIPAIVENALGDAFPFEIISTKWREIYHKEVGEGALPIKEGLYQVLDFLESKNIRKAVATSTALPLAEKKLKRIKVWDRFESVATADQVEKGKPAPDVYLLALKQLGLPADKCIALEDSPNGVTAAHSAGISVIMIPDMLPATDELKTKARTVLTSLNSVIEYMETLSL